MKLTSIFGKHIKLLIKTESVFKDTFMLKFG